MAFIYGGPLRILLLHILFYSFVFNGDLLITSKQNEVMRATKKKDESSVEKKKWTLDQYEEEDDDGDT